MSRRLAVVVPVYNEASGIAATLEALAGQDDADFDAVFVDNASTDDSVQLMETFIRRHGLTRLTRHRTGRAPPLVAAPDPQARAVEYLGGWFVDLGHPDDGGAK